MDPRGHTARRRAGDTITGRWDIAEDGSTYTTDFELVYRRAVT